jgi:hypothetical protein
MAGQRSDRESIPGTGEPKEAGRSGGVELIYRILARRAERKDEETGTPNDQTIAKETRFGAGAKSRDNQAIQISGKSEK